jgi:hypothetical protein
MGPVGCASALACRDPRVPWYVKVPGGGSRRLRVQPDRPDSRFHPGLGYLDDLVVIPLGVLLIRRWIPAEVWVDCQARAELLTTQPISQVGAAIVMGLWLLLAASPSG